MLRCRRTSLVAPLQGTGAVPRLDPASAAGDSSAAGDGMQQRMGAAQLADRRCTACSALARRTAASESMPLQRSPMGPPLLDLREGNEIEDKAGIEREVEGGEGRLGER